MKKINKVLGVVMVRFFADKFLISQKIINRMYNVLVDGTLSYSKTIQKLVLSLDESEIFVNFSVKNVSESYRKAAFWQRSTRQPTTAQPLSAFLITMCFRFFQNFQCRHSSEERLGQGQGLHDDIFDEQIKSAYWPSREVHKDFQI